MINNIINKIIVSNSNNNSNIWEILIINNKIRFVKWHKIWDMINRSINKCKYHRIAIRMKLIMIMRTSNNNVWIVDSKIGIILNWAIEYRRHNLAINHWHPHIDITALGVDHSPYTTLHFTIPTPATPHHSINYRLSKYNNNSISPLPTILKNKIRPSTIKHLFNTLGHSCHNLSPILNPSPKFNYNIIPINHYAKTSKHLLTIIMNSLSNPIYNHSIIPNCILKITKPIAINKISLS